MRWWFIPWICCCLIWAGTGCGPKEKILTEAERLQLKVDSLKMMAEDGDLITRLNDNLISHQVRFLNVTDKSYSHAGVVRTIGNVKMVCHIDADIKGADTLRYEPIDTFLNPVNNLSGGLYRYDLSPEEKKLYFAEIDRYHAMKVHFDRNYFLDTDSVLYCSEMIAKSLAKASNGRIVIATSLIPQHMLRMVQTYLETRYPIEAIAKHHIIAIDNLYLNPHCRQILKFQLKQFPDQ
jgi:hypothetical protein